MLKKRLEDESEEKGTFVCASWVLFRGKVSRLILGSSWCWFVYIAVVSRVGIVRMIDFPLVLGFEGGHVSNKLFCDVMIE